MARSSYRYVPCQAKPGMFRGELLVYVDGYRRGRPTEKIKVQLFADEGTVKGLTGQPERNKLVSGWLQVSLVGRQGGIAEIVLPQPGQPVGERMLVESKSLKQEV